MNVRKLQAGSELTTLTLRQAALQLRARRLSPVDLTRACLQRINELDNTLHAFITVTRENALEQALIAAAEMERGQWRSSLHGIPVAVKDLIDVAGVPTTAASRVLRENVAPHHSEVVRRLRDAGAVLIGKTNLHEFAYGGSSVIGAYGPVHNPLATEHTTGGSSGGSAAAVAAGMCYAAIGTDTAGSIRLPAAYCGIVGMKPTYGLVSGRGVVPLAWSFDHVGPMARSVGDVALVLAAIAGYDRDDPGSIRMPIEDYGAAIEGDISRLRLGVAREYFFDDLDSEVVRSVEHAISRLQRLTASCRDVVIPIDADRTVHNAEAWTYHREYVASSPDLYEPETLRRIRRGENIPAAEYIRARRYVESLRRGAAQIFREIDVVITPAVPILPPTISELLADVDNLRAKELLMLRNTRPFNVLGVPAISVPYAFTSAGLPVGLQLAAAPGQEGMLLAVANAVSSF